MAIKREKERKDERVDHEGNGTGGRKSSVKISHRRLSIGQVLCKLVQQTGPKNSTNLTDDPCNNRKLLGAIAEKILTK